MPEFDWVTERANCSLLKVFKSLELGVKSDVDKRNALRKSGETPKWDVTSNSDRFTAFCEGGDWSPKAVEFALHDDGISVSCDGVNFFYARLTINNNGQCRMKVHKHELEEWQVRSKALEALFFES